MSTTTALPVAPRTRRDVILEYTDNRRTALACTALIALRHDKTELAACAKGSLGTATAQSTAPRLRRDEFIIPTSTVCAALARNEELGMRDGRKVAVSCVPTLRRRPPLNTDFQSTNKKCPLETASKKRQRLTASTCAQDMSVERPGERTPRPERVRVDAREQRAVLLLPRRARRVLG